MDKERMRERMQPEHLDKLKQEIDQSQNPQANELPETAVPENDPRSQKEYSFDFAWTDGRGKRWSGKFVNQILNIGQRQAVGIMRARLSGGTPLEALDALTAELNLLVAHMTYSLIEKPEWADDLNALTDVELLQALYAEVIAHEATFLGRGQTIEASPESD